MPNNSFSRLFKKEKSNFKFLFPLPLPFYLNFIKELKIITTTFFGYY